jgi:hypothetical protein
MLACPRLSRGSHDSQRAPISPAESRDATAIAARTAAWGLAIYSATRLLSVALASASMAAAVAQAIAAEWGAGRLGVTWSDPHDPLPTPVTMARRAAVGAAYGAGLALLLAVFAAATGAVHLERAASTPISLIAIGLVTSALLAIRDEIVLHGITLRALVSVPSPIARALACGVTSAAAALGEPTATPRAAIASFLLGTAFGSLWIRDRGAWMAWGAHTAWLFVTGSLLGGGVAEMRTATSSWGGADAGILGGTAAIVALAPFTLLALSMVRKAKRA